MWSKHLDTDARKERHFFFSPSNRKTTSDLQIFSFKSSMNELTPSIHQNFFWFPFCQGTPHLETIYLAIKVSSQGSSATCFQSPSPPPMFSLLSVGKTVDSTIYGYTFFPRLLGFAESALSLKIVMQETNSGKKNLHNENNMKRIAHTDEAAVIDKNNFGVKCHKPVSK